MNCSTVTQRRPAPSQDPDLPLASSLRRLQCPEVATSAKRGRGSKFHEIGARLAEVLSGRLGHGMKILMAKLTMKKEASPPISMPVKLLPAHPEACL